MDAAPEGEMAVGLAGQVEPVGVGELGGVGLAAPTTATTVSPARTWRSPMSRSVSACLLVNCTGLS